MSQSQQIICPRCGRDMSVKFEQWTGDDGEQKSAWIARCQNEHEIYASSLEALTEAFSESS